MRLLISAGEASGDMYGAALMQALQRQSVKPIDFFGLGGERMRAGGCETVVKAEDVAVVGIAEVVTHLPRIYRKFHDLVHQAELQKPDAAILIDFPDFNLRLARQLHARNIPVIYYVSPQLWAWRPGRVEQVRKYVRKMLVIFPFEEEFYRKQGIEAEFTGHPLGDLGIEPLSRREFAGQYDLNPTRVWIALLPGSRQTEVRRILPTMLDAARILGSNREYLLPIAPTLDPAWVRSLVITNGYDLRVTFTEDARQTLVQSRAAMVASGTATVEAAVLGTPLAMVYRVSPLSWLLGRRLVKLPHFAMPNLIAGREVIREFVQRDFSAKNVAGEIAELLPDNEKRTRMLQDLATVRDRLRPAGSADEPAPDRAARAILKSVRYEE